LLKSHKVNNSLPHNTLAAYKSAYKKTSKTVVLSEVDKFQASAYDIDSFADGCKQYNGNIEDFFVKEKGEITWRFLKK
jgi:hypothetical protein